VGRIQHLLSGENPALIQWGEFSTSCSGENSALREGVCIWWSEALDWNTGATYMANSTRKLPVSLQKVVNLIINSIIVS